MVPVIGPVVKQIKTKALVLKCFSFYFVRLIGLEPTHLAIPDPKSGASTNFATGAYGVQSYRLFLICQISRGENKGRGFVFECSSGVSNKK